jgi:hypothetical protein
MARKRFTTEQIIGMLREAEVRLARPNDWFDLQGIGHFGANARPALKRPAGHPGLGRGDQRFRLSVDRFRAVFPSQRYRRPFGPGLCPVGTFAFRALA